MPVVFILCSLLLGIPSASQPSVKIKNTIIQVEVVRTPEEWTKGLMFREKLGRREGMLFLGKVSRPQSFWMKNTPISLDIIYISEKLKVVSIQKNAVPGSEEPLPSKGPAMHILEVPAGVADEIGMKEGTALEFQNIK